MGLVYLAALVFGMGVLLLQVLFGGKDVGHHDAGFVAFVLSSRFWIFTSLGFGLSGSLIHFFSLAGLVATALIAGSAGLASGVFATLAFRAVRRSSISTTSGVSDAVGQIGKVLVAITPGRVGQVRIELRGQSVDYLATTDDEELARGERVLVEEVRGTVVHVTRRPPELE